MCDLTAEQVREYRGSLTEPGRNSPYRDRSVEENLDLFRRMRAGEFPDGARTLRAKIDMAAGNINLRDPALYRIKHAEHHQTGNDWPIYPMYDFAHSLSDAVEGITHSLCTLEFEDHRPLYDWCVDKVDLAHHPELVAPLTGKGLPFEASKPRQIEFSRLNINYTVMSKRKLMALVQDGLVDSWDDPRMPSLQGIRRRGYTPSALKLFVFAPGPVEAELDDRFLGARKHAARRPRRARAAPHGGARAAEVRADEPARRPRRNAALLQSSEGRNAGRTRDSVLARAVDRAATISPKCRRRAGSAWCPAARSACAARASRAWMK